MHLVVRNAWPADAAGIARVECKARRDAYPTLVPERYLIDMLQESRRTVYWRRRLNLGAESRIVKATASGSIPGYAAFGCCRLRRLPFASELYELYLSPGQQGRAWNGGCAPRPPSFWPTTASPRSASKYWRATPAASFTRPWAAD